MTQILVANPIDHRLIARLAVAFVGADAVVGIHAPEEVDIRGSVPILGRKGHARTFVGLQQGRVNQVLRIDDALRQTASHLAVIDRVFQLLGIVLALESSLATEVVDKDHLRKLAVTTVVDAVRDGAARLANNHILLTDTAIVNERAQQGQRDIGRRVQLNRLAVGNGVVHVELDGNLLALLIAHIPLAVTLVEVLEECLPSGFRRLFASQGHHRLAHHIVRLLLVVPTLLDPETGLAIPCGHSRVMNPGHTTRIDTYRFANRFVRRDVQTGLCRCGPCSHQDRHHQ